jgi:hypothetical protein
MKISITISFSFRVKNTDSYDKSLTGSKNEYFNQKVISIRILISLYSLHHLWKLGSIWMPTVRDMKNYM